MKVIFSLIVANVATCSTAMVQARPSSELIVSLNEPLRVTVNGSPTSASMSPEGLVYPTLNPDLAKILGFSRGLIGIDARVGAVTVKGGTGVARFALSAATYKRRIVWFDRAVTQNAGLELGAGAVPQEIVTFSLHAGRTAEARYTMPLVKEGSTLGTHIVVGGQQIFLTFSLDRVATLATAAAAKIVADNLGGSLSGPAIPTEIRFGIARATRNLALGHPLVLPFGSISQMRARISDYGTTSSITDLDADPSEIVVQAPKQKSSPLYRISIGLNDLAQCSSITFNKPAAVIELRCSV